MKKYLLLISILLCKFSIAQKVLDDCVFYFPNKLHFIKNLKTNKYLYARGNEILAGDLIKDSKDFMWTIETCFLHPMIKNFGGSQQKFIFIENSLVLKEFPSIILDSNFWKPFWTLRWKRKDKIYGYGQFVVSSMYTKNFIHMEQGKVVCSPIDTNLLSVYWKFDTVPNNDAIIAKYVLPPSLAKNYINNAATKLEKVKPRNEAAYTKYKFMGYYQFLHNQVNKRIYVVLPDKPIYEGDLVVIRAQHDDKKNWEEIYERIEVLTDESIYKKITGANRCGVCYGRGYISNTYKTTVADYEYTYGKKVVRSTTVSGGCSHCGGCGLVPK